MPQGLKINDGPVAWDSPAIKLYESTADLITGGAGVNAFALSNSTPVYFGVEIENTSGSPLPGPCACQTAGGIVGPASVGTAPGNARYTVMVGQAPGPLPSLWTVAVTDTTTGTVVSGTATISTAPPTILYAPNGTTLAVRSADTGSPLNTYQYLIVDPANGQLTAWDSNVPLQAGLFVDGFSPDGKTFLGYSMVGTGAATVTVFDLGTLLPKAMGFTQGVPVGAPFTLYFTPCSDWLLRVPEVAGVVVQAVSTQHDASFGQLLQFTHLGLDATVIVQGVGVLAFQVLGRGDAGGVNQGVRISGNGLFDVQVNGVSIVTMIGPMRRATIDYRCVQALPRVEVQVEPASTCNNNQAMPLAYANFSVATGATTLARCMQAWTAPPGTVPNDPNAHFCAIAEAFTPTTINGISVPQTSAPSFAGMVGTEDNIAQQNLLITRASLARAMFTVRNPLPFAAEVTVTMRVAEGYAKRFRNWPRTVARPAQAGMRPVGSDAKPQADLKLKLEGGSERLVEIIVEVAKGSPSPSAIAYEIAQTLRGVKAGGVVMVVTHEAKDLMLTPDKPFALTLCPIRLDGKVRLAGGAADPAPGSAHALYRGLVGQRVGASFAATRTRLRDVSVYAESSSHPALQVRGAKVNVGSPDPKRPFFAAWEVDCTGVPVGHHAIMLVAQADKFEPVRLIVDFDVLEGTPWQPVRPWFEERFGTRTAPPRRA